MMGGATWMEWDGWDGMDGMGWDGMGRKDGRKEGWMHLDGRMD